MKKLNFDFLDNLLILVVIWLFILGNVADEEGYARPPEGGE